MPVDQTTLYERLLAQVGRTDLPGARRLVKVLAPRHTAAHRFRAEFFGLDYAGDLSQMIDRDIFYFGAYSPAELEFLARAADVLKQARGEVNFFDVGANTGQHSLYLCRQVTAVHAFEPSLRVSDQFRTNIDLNRVGNIRIHTVALADGDATGKLGSGLPGNSGSRSLNWTLPGAPTETVVVRAAQAYFDEAALPRIDLLKLDVEGHESKVLKGLRERLDRDRPIVLMELIGETAKGGFALPADLRAALYDRHRLLSLCSQGGRFVLSAFDWHCESAVVLPEEHAGAWDGAA